MVLADQRIEIDHLEPHLVTQRNTKPRLARTRKSRHRFFRPRLSQFRKIAKRPLIDQPPMQIE